jgi:hypothetical protein
LAALTSQAAHPVRIAGAAENIVGGSTKYLQLSAMPASCSAQKTQAGSTALSAASSIQFSKSVSTPPGRPVLFACNYPILAIMNSQRNH